jgi:hypothetical protein
MIRILGNSMERVFIKDLNDVIYYKQTKEYTDQEYESSRDLQKALNRKDIVKLEHIPIIKNSIESEYESDSMNAKQNEMLKNDLKNAIREVLSENKNGIDMSGAIREIAPLIIDTVRQEISSKLSNLSFSGEKSKPKTEFIGPEYIPDIDIKGMVSNVKAEEKQVSGSDTNDALNALRNLNNK